MRAALAVATVVGTAVLVHQMWLVLSVGGVTGIEKLMLGLFVINIAWVGFGALSPFRRLRRAAAAPRSGRPAAEGENGAL